MVLLCAWWQGRRRGSGPWMETLSPQQVCLCTCCCSWRPKSWRSWTPAEFHGAYDLLELACKLLWNGQVLSKDRLQLSSDFRKVWGCWHRKDWLLFDFQGVKVAFLCTPGTCSKNEARWPPQGRPLPLLSPRSVGGDAS